MAILSIVLNFASVILLKGDSHKDVNIKSAYLHLLSDIMTSFAVLIAFYLMYASYALMYESISILMQSTPKNIDIEKLRDDIEAFDDIQNVHHMHVWRLDDRNIFLESHIDFKDDIKLSVSSKI